MKRLLLIIICLILTLTALSKGVFTIKGTVKGEDKITKVYLYYQQRDNHIIDSCTVKNGNFSFEGKIEYPVMAILELKQKSNDAGTTPNMVKFYIEDSPISITLPAHAENPIISGSRTHNLHLEFIEILKPLRKEFDAIRSAYEKATSSEQSSSAFMDALKNRQTMAHHKNSQVVYDFIKQHPSDYLSLYLLQSQVDNTPDDIQLYSVFSNLSPEIKSSYLGKEIDLKLEKVKQTAIGSKAASFEAKDINGKSINLTDFQGKYVLITFWASDCHHCLEELPNIKKTYDVLQGQEFAIIAVAVDAVSREKYWYNFVKDNNLPWTNLFDERVDGKKKLSSLYNVDRTPFNLLLNKEGKIIARNLYGEELLQRVKTILHLSQSKMYQ